MKFTYENPETRKTALSATTRKVALQGAITRDETMRENTGSTAHKFKIGANLVEVLLRDIMERRGAGTVRNLSGAKQPGKVDSRVNGSGTEYKCGGNLGCPRHYGKFDETDIYPAAKLVVWCLYEKVETTDDLVDYSVVLTRDEFIDLLQQASRKGIHGTLALKKNGANGSDRVENLVMAFQPTPLRKIRERIEQGIETGEMITVRTWLQENGRQGW